MNGQAGMPVLPRVAVCGLGVMGGGIARRLLDQAATVHVWNRSLARAQELATRGAVAHPTPAEASADADVVLLALADGQALADVAYGPGGVLAGGPHTGVLLCAGTVDPAEVRDLATRTPMVLDIGLLGNGEHAATGALRVYAGGPAELLEKVQPVLASIAKQVVHVGALGDGMRLKLLMNLLMGVQMQALAEAVGLGVASGLDHRVVLDAIKGSGFSSPVMSFKAARMADGRFTDPDFRLSYMAKDLALAVAEAQRAGVELPVTKAATSTHADAVASGLGEQDCAAILTAVAGDRAGVTR